MVRERCFVLKGVFGGLLVSALLIASPVFAHPLGNFTMNHLSKITVRSDRVAVRYILDLAEIPSYGAMRAQSPNATMTTAAACRLGIDASE